MFAVLIRNGEFSGKASRHECTDDVIVVVFAEKVHQLCHRGFHRGVIAAHNSHALKVIPCVVSSHLNESGDALTDVDYNDATFRCFFQQMNQPGGLWGVAAAIAAHDDAPQVFHIENASHNVFFYTGKKGEDHYVGIHGVVGYHGLAPVGLENIMGVKIEVHSRVAEVGIVE